MSEMDTATTEAEPRFLIVSMRCDSCDFFAEPPHMPVACNRAYLDGDWRHDCGGRVLFELAPDRVSLESLNRVMAYINTPNAYMGFSDRDLEHVLPPANRPNAVLLE